MTQITKWLESDQLNNQFCYNLSFLILWHQQLFIVQMLQILLQVIRQDADLFCTELQVSTFQTFTNLL